MKFYFLTKYFRVLLMIHFIMIGMNLAGKAQTSSWVAKHFVPASDVVFYDDFYDTSLSALHYNWEIRSFKTWELLSVSSEGAKTAVVGGRNCVELPDGRYEYIRSKIRRILCDTCYTTIEFDYCYGSNTERMKLDLNYEFGQGWETAECSVYRNGRVKVGFLNSGQYELDVRHNVNEHILHDFIFDSTKWYHFAAAFFHKKMKLFVDGKQVFTDENIGLYPKTFNFSEPAFVTNIRVAQNEPEFHLSADSLALYALYGQSVLFDVGESQIRGAYNVFLKRLAESLMLRKNEKLTIRGCADSTGVESSNQKLSENRAKNVCDRLITLGVKPEQLEFVGLGVRKITSAPEKMDVLQISRRVDFIRKQ